MQQKFHSNLKEIRKGTAFLRQDLMGMEDRLLKLAYQTHLLNESDKERIRSEMVKNTSQSLFAIKSILSRIGDLEQTGKHLLLPGKYNIKLVCENGSNFSQNTSILNIHDMLRMEVFECNDYKLVVYGKKSLESVWIKLRSRDKTMLSPDYTDPALALKEIDAFAAKLNGRIDLPLDEKKERLADIEAIAANLRNSLEGEGAKSCRETSAKGHVDKIVKKIEWHVKQIKEAHVDDAKTVLKDLDDILKKPMPYSANRDWPLSESKADSIAATIVGRCKSDKKALEPLGSFLERYSEEMDQNTVPAPLQPQLSEFLRLAKIAALYTIAKVTANPGEDMEGNAKMETMRLRLVDINKCINEISNAADELEKSNMKFDSGELSPSCNPAEAFVEIWKMGKQRQKIYDELEKLKNAFAMLCTKNRKDDDGRDEFDRLSVMIPITMAQNFVRVSKVEAGLWREFIASYGPLLKQYLPEDAKSIGESIRKFADAADSIKQDGKKASVRSLKTKVREHDLEILKLIDNLKKFDSRLAKTIYEIFSDTKSHMLYKRGGIQILCDALAFHLTMERYLIEGIGNEGAPERLARLVESNKELFALFDKYGVTELVTSRIDSFNHFEPNALDSNPDYRKLVEAGSQGGKFELGYKHYVESAQDGKKVEIVVDAPKFAHSFYLPDKIPAYTDGEFDDNSIDVILYGAKQPLGDYLNSLDPAFDRRRNPTAKDAYGIISNAYLSSQADFLDVREKMGNKNTYEFLASFALKQRMMNGAILMPNEGEMASNDPRRIFGENKLLEGAGLTPDKIEYYLGKVDWYLKLSPARIMLHSMHSRKVEWALECAKKIASDPPKPANLAFSW